LAVVISLPELIHNAQIISGQNVNYMIPTFIVVACMYFIVNYSLSILSRRLELR
ncbi:TPA: amino acid ABC transporter permease, partial [Streptococcus agalactiae]